MDRSILPIQFQMEQKNTLESVRPLYLLAKTLYTCQQQQTQMRSSLAKGSFCELFHQIDVQSNYQISLDDIRDYCAVDNIRPFATLAGISDPVDQVTFIERMVGEQGIQPQLSPKETSYLFVRYVQLLARNQQTVRDAVSAVTQEQIHTLKTYFLHQYQVEQLTRDSLIAFLQHHGLYHQAVVEGILGDKQYIRWGNLFLESRWEDQLEEGNMGQNIQEIVIDNKEDIFVQIDNIEQVLKEKKFIMSNRFKEIEDDQIFLPSTQQRNDKYLRRNESSAILRKSEQGGKTSRNELSQSRNGGNERENSIDYVELIRRRENSQLLRQRYLKRSEDINTFERSRLPTSTLMRLKQIEDSSKQTLYLSTRNYQKRIYDALNNTYTHYQPTGIRLKTLGPIYGIKAERKVQWYLSKERRFM